MSADSSLDGLANAPDLNFSAGVVLSVWFQGLAFFLPLIVRSKQCHCHVQTEN